MELDYFSELFLIDAEHYPEQKIVFNIIQFFHVFTAEKKMIVVLYVLTKSLKIKNEQLFFLNFSDLIH